MLGDLPARSHDQIGRRRGVQAQSLDRSRTCAGSEQAPPREGVGEHPLGAERLGSAHELSRAPAPEAEQRPQRAVRTGEALELASLAGGHAVTHAQTQDRGQLLQARHVDEIVQAPHAHPFPGIGPQPTEPVTQGRHPVGGGVAEGGVPVLHVVVQGPIDEHDVPLGEGDQPEPVVVEMGELGRRERQGVVEQIAPHQRGRAGDGVGHQQRKQIGVVVAPARPVRVGDQLALLADHPGVAVGQRC